MTFKRLWIAVAVLTLLGVDAARAQTGTTTHVFTITLTGSDCIKAQNIFLVIDGDDRHGFHVDGKPCDWSYPKKGSPVNIDTIKFSLRWRGRRTECQKAEKGPYENSERVAQLTFYRVGGTKSVKLHAEGEKHAPVDVGYIRHVRKDPKSPGSDKCNEWGLLDELGLQSIDGVDSRIEEIRLQFPSDGKVNDNYIGLLVDDEAVPTNVDLTRAQIFDALNSQSNRAKRSSGPNDAIPSKANDKKMLDASQLRTLRIVAP